MDKILARIMVMQMEETKETIMVIKMVRIMDQIMVMQTA